MVEVEQSRDGHDTELLVVDASKGGHAAEPQAEEAVGPTLGLKDLEGEKGVVVDGVNDHLHQVNAVALDLDVLAGQNVHGHVDEALDTAVDLATQAEHHGLSQLASTYPLDASLDAIREHISDHRVESLGVLGLLGQLRSTKLDKVIKCRKHILQVVLGAGLEGGVDELKGLPHGGGNGLGSESAAIDNLENLVVEICA